MTTMSKPATPGASGPTPAGTGRRLWAFAGPAEARNFPVTRPKFHNGTGRRVTMELKPEMNTPTQSQIVVPDAPNRTVHARSAPRLAASKLRVAAQAHAGMAEWAQQWHIVPPGKPRKTRLVRDALRRTMKPDRDPARVAKSGQLRSDGEANGTVTAAIVAGVIGIVIIAAVLSDSAVTASMSPLTILILGFITVAMAAGLVRKAFASK